MVAIYGVSCGLGSAFAPRFGLRPNPIETIGEPSSLEFFTTYAAVLIVLRRSGNLESACCCFKPGQADLRIIPEEALGD